MVRRRRDNGNRGRNGALLSPFRSVSSRASPGFEFIHQYSSSQPHHLSSAASTSALAHSKHQNSNTALSSPAQAQPFNQSHHTKLSSSIQAVKTLLQNPIKFVQATRLTLEDEETMAPVLRSRIIDRNESTGQRNHRLLVRYLLKKILHITNTMLTDSPYLPHLATTRVPTHSLSRLSKSPQSLLPEQLVPSITPHSKGCQLARD